MIGSEIFLFVGKISRLNFNGKRKIINVINFAHANLSKFAIEVTNAIIGLNPSLNTKTKAFCS